MVGYASAPIPPVSRPLAGMAKDIRAAQRVVQAKRAFPVVPADLLAARQGLLNAMEDFAGELAVRRLPIPHQLRDDLRLLREVAPKRTRS